MGMFLHEKGKAEVVEWLRELQRKKRKKKDDKTGKG